MRRLMKKMMMLKMCSGVFITLSIVLERMRYENVVDIFTTVKLLRTQRANMVQTEVHWLDE